MDPRERADATLARARARGAFVVTPESAISPMDAASTLQIPRTVVAANDERQSDPDATMVVPGSVARGRGEGAPEDNIPAIAQEALTDVVSAPPGIRSRQRRLEDTRQAIHRQQQKPSPTPKPVPTPSPKPVQVPQQPTQPPAQQPTMPLTQVTQPVAPPSPQPTPPQPVPPPAPPAPEELDGLIPTTKEPPTTRSTLSQRLDG